MLEGILDLNSVEEENTEGVEQGFIYHATYVLGPKEEIGLLEGRG